MKSDEQIQFNTLPQDPTPGKKPSGKKSLASIFAWGIVVLLIGTLAFLFLTNRLELKDANSGELTTATVCGTEVVKQYNDIAQNAFDTTEAARAQTNQKIQAVVDAFQQDKNYVNDPTCLFIAYASAMNTGNKDAARSFVGKITEYSEQGVFVDTRVIGIMSVTQLQGMVREDIEVTGDGLGSG